jgi:hypothetical protein
MEPLTSDEYGGDFAAQTARPLLTVASGTPRHETAPQIVGTTW